MKTTTTKHYEYYMSLTIIYNIAPVGVTLSLRNDAAS